MGKYSLVQTSAWNRYGFEERGFCTFVHTSDIWILTTGKQLYFSTPSIVARGLQNGWITILRSEVSHGTRLVISRSGVRYPVSKSASSADCIDRKLKEPPLCVPVTMSYTYSWSLLFPEQSQSSELVLQKRPRQCSLIRCFGCQHFVEV